MHVCCIQANAMFNLKGEHTYQFVLLTNYSRQI